MKKSRFPDAATASRNITALIKQLREVDDWRGQTLAQVRKLIHDADPAIQEDWKWGIPVWSHDGGICTGESYKKGLKLTFYRGASLKDPRGLFTSSLEGNTRRAIDIGKGEKINQVAFKALIRSAVAANSAARAERATRKN